jgi:hypothetical protein
MAEGNAATIEIVGGQLHSNHISLDDFNEKFSHLARNMRQHEVLILQAHPKERVREHLDHSACDFDGIGFCCLRWS